MVARYNSPRFRQISLVAILAVLFLIFGVEQRPSLAAPNRAPTVVMPISGTITTGTWINTNIYWISGNATVDAAATLTIQAGTIVKFDTNASLTVNGTLVLQGAQGSEVIFTSIRDDLYGGDTNGDGTNTLPAAGNWSAIILTNGNTTFQYAKVLYATKGVQVKNSGVSAIAPSILNNIFQQNKNGIALDINSYANITSLIEGNIFTMNEYGLSASQASGKTGTSFPILRNNTFNTSTLLPIFLGGSAFPSYENNAFSGYPNLDQRLGIGVGGNYTASGTFLAYNSLNGQMLPYVVVADMTLTDNYTLTLPVNTILKFDLGKQLTVRGKLVNEGTAIVPAIITSIRDDSVGGDVNGDTTDTEPRPSDWKHISFVNKDIVFQN